MYGLSCVDADDGISFVGFVSRWNRTCNFGCLVLRCSLVGATCTAGVVVAGGIFRPIV